MEGSRVPRIDRRADSRSKEKRRHAPGGKAIRQSGERKQVRNEPPCRSNL